jgi:hypothetical protein
VFPPPAWFHLPLGLAPQNSEFAQVASANVTAASP